MPVEMADQVFEELHVVDRHLCLGRITHIPAPFAAAVAFALRIADGESVAVGRCVHSEGFGIGISSVSVQDDDQRGIVGQVGRQVQAIGSLDSAGTEGFGAGLLGRDARGAIQQEHRQQCFQQCFHGYRMMFFIILSGPDATLRRCRGRAAGPATGPAGGSAAAPCAACGGRPVSSGRSGRRAGPLLSRP